MQSRPRRRPRRTRGCRRWARTVPCESFETKSTSRTRRMPRPWKCSRCRASSVGSESCVSNPKARTSTEPAISMCDAEFSRCASARRQPCPVRSNAHSSHLRSSTAGLDHAAAPSSPLSRFGIATAAAPNGDSGARAGSRGSPRSGRRSLGRAHVSEAITGSEQNGPIHGRRGFREPTAKADLWTAPDRAAAHAKARTGLAR